MTDPDAFMKEIEEISKEECEALLLSAMGKIVKVLEPFQNSERHRILKAVMGFYQRKRMNEEA